MRKLLKKYAFAPERLVTDDFRSYAPAARDLGIEHLLERGLEEQPGREFASADLTAGAQDATFRSTCPAQKFLTAHAAV
jgi:hypothetical protein